MESSNLDLESCLRTSPVKFSVFEESCRFSDSTELETVSLRPGSRHDQGLGSKHVQGLGSIHDQNMERTVPGCSGDYFNSPRVKVSSILIKRIYLTLYPDWDFLV